MSQSAEEFYPLGTPSTFSLYTTINLMEVFWMKKLCHYVQKDKYIDK